MPMDSVKAFQHNQCAQRRQACGNLAPFAPVQTAPFNNINQETAMKLKVHLTGLLCATALLACAPVAPLGQPDADAVLRRAEQAMGGQNLKTLSYSGSGSGATFGQAYKPGLAWPKLSYSNFARVLDYDNAALREEFARSRAEPTGGGAAPLMGTGEQRAVAMLRGTDAWNMIGPAPLFAGVALDGRIHDLWTTPHGVIKAALRNKATLTTRSEGGKTLSAMSFTEPGRFTATALINADNLVERVESRLPNPVLGDTDVITSYSDYRDFGGVKFPMHIRQSAGGYPVLDLEVKEVQPNVATAIEVPALVRAATEKVTTEKAAEGVWFMGGGSHNSVAIEMKDYLLLVEAPLYDGRSSAVLAEVKKLAPGKPVRYVVNSHHHFDHAGGLRTAVADGATLITSAQAKPWFEKVLANPNRIQPDLLAKSGKKASIQGVNGKQVLTDGTRSVEIYDIADSVHSEGFMMVYLPADKLLIQADAYTPGLPGAAPPAQPNGNNVNLMQNIDQLKLSVDRILPLHGRMVPVTELYSAVGRKP
jgi:glyoxylase-like metal-dependent hydrolase (beta-lactamase superfamily II)